jgi:hypothetical protein
MINIQIVVDAGSLFADSYDWWMGWKLYLMDLMFDCLVCGLYGGVGLGVCFGWLWGFSQFYDSLNDWMDDFVYVGEG